MLECLLSQQEISVARTTQQLGLLVEQINFSMWSFFMTILVALFIKKHNKKLFHSFSLFIRNTFHGWCNFKMRESNWSPYHRDSISLKSQTTLPTCINVKLYCYVDTIIFCTFSLTQQQASLNMQWWLYFLEKTG